MIQLPIENDSLIYGLCTNGLIHYNLKGEYLLRLSQGKSCSFDCADIVVEFVEYLVNFEMVGGGVCRSFWCGDFNGGYSRVDC